MLVNVTEFVISPDDLRRLARLVEENNLSELRYEQGDVRVTLRTPEALRAARTPVVPAPPLLPGADFADTIVEPATMPGNGPDLAHDASLAGVIAVEAPVMGVFYRSPAPGEPSLVEIGDTVEAGQPVGLIEAMKVFSEVLAETAGIVRAIPAKNGALVQPGDALLLIEPGQQA